MTDIPQNEPIVKPSKKELLDMLSEMIATIERMPPNAFTIAINHYDWLSLLILLRALFDSDCISDS